MIVAVLILQEIVITGVSSQIVKKNDSDIIVYRDKFICEKP